MSGEPEIRDMQEDDLPAVRELSEQLGYPVSLDALRARYRRIVRRPEQAVVVARQAGRVVGWIHVQTQHPLESEPAVEIMGLVVAASVRRGGVGRALVTWSRRWAREHGYARLRVRSNVERDVAHSFYPALGFRLAKTQHTYVMDVDA